MAGGGERGCLLPALAAALGGPRRHRGEPEVSKGARPRLVVGGGGPVSSSSAGMWLDAANCLLCGALGRSQEHLRSEGRGIS